MAQRPPDVTPEIAQGDLTEDQLQHYLKQKEVAVDTETMGLNPLRDRLCVVQLCDRSRRAVLVQIPAVPGRRQPTKSGGPQCWTAPPLIRQASSSPKWGTKTAA